MKLTALEIKQQKFEKTFRGYDAAEVQAFLGLISNEWEHLVAKNRELQKQIESLEEKLKHYERVEEALHETLQTAKESAEQKLSVARKDARNKIEKAEMEADSIVREATQRRQQIRQSILRLLDRRKEIIGGIRSYLELAHESLEKFTEDEANLFAYADAREEETFDEAFRKQIEMRSDRKKDDSRHEEDEDDTQPVPPGAEDVDEIIDRMD